MKNTQKRDYLKQQSHEQLEMFVLQGESTEKRLRERLFLLTGCRYFGDNDVIDGTCVDCGYNNPNLFNRCCAFVDMIDSYRKDQITQDCNKALKTVQSIRKSDSF